MSARHCDNPWVFRRDEFNVLEESYDDVLRRHDAAGRTRAFEAEEAVIREQARTEELSEAELSLRVGPGWLEAPEGPCEVHGADESDSRPLAEQLRAESERDPLYAAALRWSMGLFRWSRARYDRRRNSDPDVFRVLVNAPLVPMKVNFALCEQEHADRFAVDIAEKEYELAETYAERVLAALERLCGEGGERETSAARIADGRTLLADIRRARERLRLRRGLPPTLPL
jgi:hypothetical protein